MRLIGLAGKARSGKDTVAGMIQELVPGTRTLAFAEPMKRFLKEIFDWDERHVTGELKEVEDRRYPRGDFGHGLLHLTPRRAMQLLGTEFGRDAYPHVWVEYAMRRVKQLLAVPGDEEGTDTGGAPESRTANDPHARLVVITDCRFINEAKAIREAGGVVWKIDRPGAGAAGGIAKHASEEEMDSLEFWKLVSLGLKNDQGLTELRILVAAALSLKIKEN